MTIYRAFFVNELNGYKFSEDFRSEVEMEARIDDYFFMGVAYNGYIIIEVER